MSKLRIFVESAPSTPVYSTRRPWKIVAKLAEAGIGYERWRPTRPLAPGARPEEVLAAYAPQIERLKAERGYQAVDVVSMHPEHPERAALRAKFLDEHTHAEDEVRFFVAGSGLFTLHLGSLVYELEARAGDLVSVPAGTRHWFDMGEKPFFIAIRLFNNPAGWVANFTGSDIAGRFPRYRRDSSLASG